MDMIFPLPALCSLYYILHTRVVICWGHQEETTLVSIFSINNFSCYLVFQKRKDLEYSNAIFLPLALLSVDDTGVARS